MLKGPLYSIRIQNKEENELDLLACRIGYRLVQLGFVVHKLWMGEELGAEYKFRSGRTVVISNNSETCYPTEYCSLSDAISAALSEIAEIQREKNGFRRAELVQLAKELDVPVEDRVEKA